MYPTRGHVFKANRYYPSGDIGWREDPIGDLQKQVRTFAVSGLAKDTGQIRSKSVDALQVMVARFHALSEKARNTTGGVRPIQFFMAVVDAQTAELLI